MDYLRNKHWRHPKARRKKGRKELMGMAGMDLGDHYVSGFLVRAFFPLIQRAGFKFVLSGLNIEETWAV
jgi:hypothetical protein